MLHAIFDLDRCTKSKGLEIIVEFPGGFGKLHAPVGLLACVDSPEPALRHRGDAEACHCSFPSQPGFDFAWAHAMKTSADPRAPLLSLVDCHKGSEV